MWVIRFLSGPLAGKTYPLQPGRNTIGRSEQANLPIAEQGVSKLHAELYVLEDKVILTDLESSNGSYVNGVRVQSKKLVPSDKISIHNIIFDVHKLDPAAMAAHAAQVQAQMQQQAVQQQHMQPTPPQQMAYQPPTHPEAMGVPDGLQGPDMDSPQMGADGTPPPVEVEKRFKNLNDMVKHYIDDVALPGVYHLAKITDFKWVLTCFILGLILIVTALSMIPMIQITKASIEKESQRHARSIARNMAKNNEAALIQGQESAVSVQEAKLEEGVTEAMIISHIDGHIIAPVDHMGGYADKPFIHSARRESKEVVRQLDDNTVGASVPVSYYNSQVGSYQVVAHAVILYDMSTLAVNDGRTLSLFIQTLAMAFIVGGIIFFFMFRLIEEPVRQVNRDLDQAIRDGVDNITTPYLHPTVATLCENLSSLLARALYGNADSADAMAYQADKDIEADNLLRIMASPGIAINAETRMVVAANELFESIVEVTLMDMKEKGIEAIPDQAFQLSLQDLTDRVLAQPTMIASNELEVRGVECEISAQAISNKGTVDYLIVTIQQLGDEEEDAA